MTVCEFPVGLGNIHGDVVEAGENVCESSRSGRIATIVTTLTDGDDSSPFVSSRFMTMLWRGWISNRALRHIGIVTVQFRGFYSNVTTCGCVYFCWPLGFC